MYEYENKADDNVNFESNLTKKRKGSHERAVLQRQDTRLVKNIGKPLQAKVVQRIGEEDCVAKDKDVLEVKRGNVKGDIIATEGKSYFLVQQIPNILTEIAINLDVLCKDADMYGSMGREAKQIVDNINGLDPFIHALVVKYLKVGNCLDFSKLVFAKLVEKNYGKWIYRCYLDKRVIVEQRDDEICINVRYKKGTDFNILEPTTYSMAEIKYKDKYVQFEEYVNGNNPTGYRIECKEGHSVKYEIMGDLIMEKYYLRILRFRQKNIYDHAFVITYPDEVKTVSEMKRDEAMVVDSWYGCPPMLLRSFLERNNPYRAVLAEENIKIAEIQKSRENPFNFPKIEQMIQNIVAGYAKKINKDDLKVKEIYNRACRGEDIDRVY